MTACVQMTHFRFACSAALFVISLKLIAAQDEEIPQQLPPSQPAPTWKRQYGVKVATPQPGDCSETVRRGDIVFVRHRGIYGNSPEKMVQFDGDGGAPLRFIVGEGKIIRGMEAGVIGQCLKETRWVEIPPKLAYDDEKKFPRGSWDRQRPKPVPDGTTVLYEITMEQILRPGSLSYELGNVWLMASSLGPWLLGAVALFGGVYLLSKYKKSKRSNKAKDKIDAAKTSSSTNKKKH